ncbi:MAG: Dihydroorotase [Promethearchaeota archaeon CR_4]|nr:MAG: Dihydroorotase [Candidatus Lokiarchaeota archaeon CR_4]
MIYLADGYFYVNAHFQWGALQIDGFRISAFQPLDPEVRFEAPLWDPSAKTMRLGGKYVLPGLIDAHVHFRDMDQKEKETIETGSRAALHGGVTTVVNMPNTRPPATLPEIVAAWQILALKNCYINVAFLSGVPPLSRWAALADLVEKPIKGFKVYLYAPLQPENAWHRPEILQKFLHFAQRRSQLVCFHSDIFQPEAIRQQRYESAILSGKTELEAFDETHPEQDEVAAIEYILQEYRNLENTHPIHFCHVSSPAGIEILLAAKREGLNISWEVTPHHMLLCTKDTPSQASFAKVLNPIRSEHARDEIFRYVKDGHVPIIATDHAPHTLQEKSLDFFKTPAGIPGVELLGPLLLTEIFEGRLPEHILDCVTSNPADRFNFANKGRIAPGFDADIVIFEKIDSYPVNSSSFYTNAKFSPYEHRPLRARVTDVFLGGELVLYQGKERLAPSGTLIS